MVPRLLLLVLAAAACADVAFGRSGSGSGAGSGATKAPTGAGATKAPTAAPTAVYGCNSNPLTGQTSCANCVGLAFIKSHNICTGCMRGTGTKITASNVGKLSPPAILCTAPCNRKLGQCPDQQ